MKKIVGVTGMPGAGKATVKQIVQNLGYTVVVMGDVIREEAKRRNLEFTPENLGWLMVKLREEDGPAVVAKRCMLEVKKKKENFILIDGVRSLREVQEFKKHFSHFTLIAIHASPKTRFHRLRKRKRSDDPQTWKTFVERDLRELSVGLGDVIATTDCMMINEGAKEQLEKKVRIFLEKWNCERN